MYNVLLCRIEAIDNKIAKAMKLTVLVDLKIKRKRLVRRLNNELENSISCI